MKIVDIFANGKLFAFHYKGENDHELERLLDLWNDPNYLYGFIATHSKDTPKDKTPYKLYNEILDNANDLEDILDDIATDNDRQFEAFFKPLHNQEFKVVELSMQKGRKNYLRLYALRIDDNCFVITGGAIKFTHLMEERPHTLE